MKIIDEDLLAEFRTPGKCDLCGKRCRTREPHHVYGRGMGGGGRMDIPINLLGLGGPFECGCHRAYHDGKIGREDMLSAVAKREQTTSELIVDEINRLRRTNGFEQRS